MFPFRSPKTVKSGINIHVRVVCLNIVKFLSKIILLMFISFLQSIWIRTYTILLCDDKQHADIVIRHEKVTVL